ncbi:hypothetical protein ZWY2020_003834 [Hordeum vulgare]|nr:hypothetical protein ZWY2020_003834 [Hordeum vulgare]
MTKADGLHCRGRCGWTTPSRGGLRGPPARRWWRNAWRRCARVWLIVCSFGNPQRYKHFVCASALVAGNEASAGSAPGGHRRAWPPGLHQHRAPRDPRRRLPYPQLQHRRRDTSTSCVPARSWPATRPAPAAPREDTVVPGLPASTSIERLEILDDGCHILSFSIVGGEHRLRNYRSVSSITEFQPGPYRVFVESYVVPDGWRHRCSTGEKLK